MRLLRSSLTLGRRLFPSHSPPPPPSRFLHQSSNYIQNKKQNENGDDDDDVDDWLIPSDKYSQSSSSRQKQQQQRNSNPNSPHNKKNTYTSSSTQNNQKHSKTKHTHRYLNMDDTNDSDLAPHKQLLMDAAAEIRADQVRREEAKPKNIGEGTVKLFADSLGGVTMGAAAVVMGPVQGYKESGPKGAASGLLGGLALGVASTTMGIGNGIAGFVHGTSKSASKINPPKNDSRLSVEQLEHFHRRDSYKSKHNSESTSSSSATDANRNMSKDEVKQQIRQKYLADRKHIYGELMAEHSANNAAASMDGLVPPVDNELYHELQVDVDATPAQIRKAYYRMAQLYHPDKHPNDPEATEKFQKISSAYQILSDPVKREEYHRLGQSAAENETMMDPKALFILMFADFEHIVGDLATATILMSGQDEPQDQQQDGTSAPSNDEELNSRMEERRRAREEKRKQFQELREAQLVKLLEVRLKPWMSGDEETFIEHAKLEVLYLRDEPFGRDCLKTAGYIYRKRASKLVDSKGPLQGVANFFEDIGDKAHSLTSKIRAIEGGIKAITSSERAEENETHDDAARREAINTLGAVWLTSVVDIESTLRKVVNKFLSLDNISSTNKQEMKRRAGGLMVLGKIFDQA